MGISRREKMMFRRRKLLALVSLLALTVLRHDGLTQQSASTTPMVLIGATLIDGTGRPAISDSVVVIDGDKFTSVGGKGTSYPSNATVVNLAGKFIIPGLVDSHTHSRPWCGELYLNH